MGQKNKNKKNKNQKEQEPFNDFKDQFNSEEDRIAYTATLIIAIAAAIYACFHMNKFMALFYSPRNPMWRNILQFISLMACCWLFGLGLSKSLAFGLKLKNKVLKKKD